MFVFIRNMACKVFNVAYFQLWQLMLGLQLCMVPIAHATQAQPQVLRVIYGSPLAGVENFNQVYQLRLLKAALDASGQPYELIPAGRDLVQSRLLKEIAAKRIDIYWSMTSTERERLLLPIRIPLDKGLNGWRLLLVAKTQQDVFNKVQSLADLSKYVLLQGHDWPDTQILKFNGLIVDTSQHPAQLFDMLRKGRAVGFPRSVVEISAEMNEHQPELAIDPHLVLYYPSAVYFFVNKANQPLANAVERGLQRLQASGQFEQMFWQEYGAALKQANLPGRVMLSMRNPDLPLLTPLDNKSLWYQPIYH